MIRNGEYITKDNWYEHARVFKECLPLARRRQPEGGRVMIMQSHQLAAVQAGPLVSSTFPEHWKSGGQAPAPELAQQQTGRPPRDAKLWSPMTKIKVRLRRRGKYTVSYRTVVRRCSCEENEVRPIQHCFRQSVYYSLVQNRTFLFIAFITAASSSRFHASAAKATS